LSPVNRLLVGLPEPIWLVNVREDVLDGYFWPATAEVSFCVSLNADSTVNIKKTEQLRSSD
jgi:hypothetical protein